MNGNQTSKLDSENRGKLEGRREALPNCCSRFFKRKLANDMSAAMRYKLTGGTDLYQRG